MRKVLKNLRYQAEFFAHLYAKRDADRFIERLKILQDVFGDMNDVCDRSRLT
jgi:triphosphatase